MTGSGFLGLSTQPHRHNRHHRNHHRLRWVVLALLAIGAVIWWNGGWR